MKRKGVEVNDFHLWWVKALNNQRGIREFGWHSPWLYFVSTTNANGHTLVVTTFYVGFRETGVPISVAWFIAISVVVNKGSTPKVCNVRPTPIQIQHVWENRWRLSTRAAFSLCKSPNVVRIKSSTSYLRLHVNERVHRPDGRYIPNYPSALDTSIGKTINLIFRSI
jgi:hypothetical protein